MDGVASLTMEVEDTLQQVGREKVVVTVVRMCEVSVFVCLFVCLCVCACVCVCVCVCACVCVCV